MMMTSAQVVETSVNVTSNSPSQDYTHPDDHNLKNYDMTPGFKPFTVLQLLEITWTWSVPGIFGKKYLKKAFAQVRNAINAACYDTNICVYQLNG